MRVIVLILLSLVLNLVLILDVKAIAVASDYLEDGTLELIEGTSTIYNIQLQNPDSYTSKYKVVYDDKYMKAIDFKEEYTLPPKSSESIKFNITAPKYKKDNNVFTLSYTVHQLSGGDESGISFLTKINKQFKLKAVKDPDRFHINYFYVVYVIILLIIIFFLFKKSSNRKIIK